MITYNRYVDNKDHTWYDSSNVLYSMCYDNNGNEKVLKLVFKQGRTYIYKGVDVNDYLAFKTADSNGKAFNQYIKKYEAIRIQDTDLEKLEALKDGFMNEKEKTDEVFSDLAYHISYNDATGEFALMLNGKPVYKGIEGQVSVVNLLKSMGIGFSMSEDFVPKEEDVMENDLKKEENNEQC